MWGRFPDSRYRSQFCVHCNPESPTPSASSKETNNSTASMDPGKQEPFNMVIRQNENNINNTSKGVTSLIHSSSMPFVTGV